MVAPEYLRRKEPAFSTVCCPLDVVHIDGWRWQGQRCDFCRAVRTHPALTLPPKEHFAAFALGVMVKQVQLSAHAAVSAMQQIGSKSGQAQTVAAAAAEALELITSRIVAISDSNHIIASAAEEQSKVAREIDRNIVTISDLAAQTAAGANQTTASSAELSRLAVDLNNLVVKFKV